MDSDFFQFHTKIVGVTFEGRQRFVVRLRRGEQLKLVRQPNNPYDPNAIAVFDSQGNQLGYIRRELAAEMAYKMDRGIQYTAEVTEVTGGDPGMSFGANILITRHSDDYDYR